MWPDIFNDDAFSLVTLTAVINDVDHVPGRAGELAFAGVGEGVATTSIALEQINQSLSLIQTSARGAPAPQETQNKGKVWGSITIPQIKLEETIQASSLQNIRELGSQNTLRAQRTVIDRQITKMGGRHDLTLENLRLGALRGTVLDADGSTLLNLFTAFGVTQPTAIDFDDVFVNATPTDVSDLTTIRTRAQQVIRFMKRNIKAPWPSSAQVWAFCGDNFFDKLIECTSVKGVWNGWQAAQQRLGANYAQGVYDFADIMWENYAGTDDQSSGNDATSASVAGTVGIDPDECQFFITGVPGLYAEYYAPADFFESLNSLGIPRYAKIAPDNKFNQVIYLHTQQNPLPLCTRPRTLIRGTSNTTA